MALRCPDLPFLPGYTFNAMLGKTKFNMDPKFDFIGDGVPALVEKVKPNMFGPLSDKYPSIYPRGEVIELPAWISFDKQILCFDAFFKETVEEMKGTPFAARRVKIYYFLEDGTIQVIEPKVENSGIAQGTLICRHRIRFPPPMDDNFYEMIDLNIGKEVEFYGRVFKITDCDRFARNFLNRCGIPVTDPINTPQDPYFVVRQKEATSGRKLSSKKKEKALEKFLANDRKVLRFYGYWDDQETVFGYLHRLEILYFLADDTIEIREVSEESCDKKSSFIFLHREKIPKTYDGLPKPGYNSTSTVLNVLGTGPQGGRYIIDPLSCGVEVTVYYCEKDLFIGSVINCYGRKLVLTDCDPYTREYYRSKYGLNSLDAITLPEDKHKVVKPEKERELPPWNGFGTYEDSAQNCITVEPKAPYKDFKKFLTLDRTGLDSHILRFHARMISRIPENCTRKFIICFYLADDSIAVFERGIRNSGFDTKTFFARRPVELPGQEIFTSKPPITYSSQDMYIGATIIINNFKFELINADEYALRYMEIHDLQYPKANIKVIMGKIRDKLKSTYKDFVAENMPKEGNTISYQKLREKLVGILGDDFTEHEMITISRAFPGDVSHEEKYNRETIRGITLTELKRGLWDDLTRLKENFLLRDPERTGLLPKKECYTILRACRLPLERELIEKILQVIQKDDEGYLHYEDILNFLNRDICKLPDVEPVNIKHELSCIKMIEYQPYATLNWCAFNNFLNLEDTFKEQGVNTIKLK